MDYLDTIVRKPGMVGYWRLDLDSFKPSIDGATRDIFGYRRNDRRLLIDDLKDMTRRPDLPDKRTWGPLFPDWEPTNEPFVATFRISPLLRFDEVVWIRSTIVYQRTPEMLLGTVEVLDIDDNQVVDLREFWLDKAEREGRL
ncbi:hypothetical protein EN817_20760 [Mesorhizobium sp. M3A.F.Ca.ET.174.01.1.1]|uniref:hypothetical protein n=1 Tax=unclassified Mesorhizobium TaxID=325217 RepID=UPI0010933F67|nr:MULTISPECIES: hypothetical protein [unclassified Mesorhizobium]TGS85782.1 hypothetical protein EN818_17580 [Mesorhizobium sp. M3A.F.Ca.ET.175.01.1.1]TGT23908.1 hypothetical protein EN817_20760 [Mesorhizobium sp. M3A.F.Ca.ET.174.01.1.1]